MDPSVILFSFVLLGMLQDAELQSCKPDCTGFSEGDLVADPLDCRRYYECQSSGLPSDTSVRCPNGDNFDPFNHMCSNVGCVMDCEPCEFTCLAAGDIIVDAFDCSVYYKCNSIPEPVINGICPQNTPYFDSVNDECSADESVCCNLGCEPYCKFGITEAPDPENCLYYYDCKQEPPSHVACSEGVYDIGTGKCSPDAECKIACQYIPPADSTSTQSTSAIPTADPTSTKSTSAIPTADPTSTKSTSASTTTPPGTGSCLESFLCAQTGFFPKCPDECDPRYFYCQSVGSQGIDGSCLEDFVFNPIPGYAYCVSPSDCPHSM